MSSPAVGLATRRAKLIRDRGDRGWSKNVKLMDLSRSAFAICAFPALLLGCAQGAAPVAHAAAPQLQPPKVKRAILYISSETTASVYLFDYPKGRLVRTIIGFYAPAGLCSDANGDVWVTDTDTYTGTGYLDEYAPGGKSPIATLEDPGNSPRACAVDPTTGNLAVADSQNNIAIYPGAQAPPTYYATAGLVEKPTTITYDAAGNAYFAGASRQAAWLPTGASEVMSFSMKPSPRKFGPLRWDGQYLTLLTRTGEYGEVWRYELLGGSAKRVGSIEVDCCMGDYAIVDSILAATLPVFNSVSVTRYPAGGKAFLGIANVEDPSGIAISFSPGAK
jgi:DNA-binding beta-propeller fold protein YncE